MLLASLLAARLLAHPTPYSNIAVDVSTDSTTVSVVAYAYDFAQELKLSEAEVVDPAFAGSGYGKLAALVRDRLVIAFDGRVARSEIAGAAVSSDRKTATVRLRYGAGAGDTMRITARLFPYDPLHESFVTVRLDGRLVAELILTADRPSGEAALGAGLPRRAVVERFIRSGVEHIAVGPDHVLFLIGLLLLGGTVWQLIGIVTAFTVAHSVTLSLAVLDVVSPPAALVEPAIALTICVVAGSNLASIYRDRGASPPRSPLRARSRGPLRPAPLAQGAPQGAPETAVRHRDYRVAFAFFFGLIHGFGFAAVLKTMALPQAALGWSLFAFNLGVEIGQLAIVAVVATLLVWIARVRPGLHRSLGIGGSLAVLWAGFFWFVQRTFFG